MKTFRVSPRPGTAKLREVLLALAGGPSTTRAIADELGLPMHFAWACLATLANDGLLIRSEGRPPIWQLRPVGWVDGPQRPAAPPTPFDLARETVMAVARRVGLRFEVRS